MTGGTSGGQSSAQNSMLGVVATPRLGGWLLARMAVELLLGCSLLGSKPGPCRSWSRSRARPCPLMPPAPSHSYLVMPFMGTDLGKLMKHETLSEDRIQFLVYQILKGLKVGVCRGSHGKGSAGLWLGSLN